MQRISDEVQRVLFPALCLHCGQALPAPLLKGLCAVCREEGAPPGDWNPFPEPGVGNLAPLNPIMRTLIHALKYRGMGWTVPVLMQMAPPPPWTAAQGPVLVPVPLTATRRRERGYNQSALLAQALAQVWGGRVVEGLLRRRRWAGSQTRLDPTARARNVAGVFYCPALPMEQRNWPWVVVDDVYTTGATAHACAWALRQAGARTVEIWTALREEPATAKLDWKADLSTWW